MCNKITFKRFQFYAPIEINILLSFSPIKKITKRFRIKDVIIMYTIINILQVEHLSRFSPLTLLIVDMKPLQMMNMDLHKLHQSIDLQQQLNQFIHHQLPTSPNINLNLFTTRNLCTNINQLIQNLSQPTNFQK